MSEQQTHRIDVGVETSYIDDQSDPQAERYVFAYTITISNTGSTPAKLLNRHWLITDGNGPRLTGSPFAGLLARAARLGERSDGLFEPSIGALTGLWGFGRDDTAPTAPTRCNRHQNLFSR